MFYDTIQVSRKRNRFFQTYTISGAQYIKISAVHAALHGMKYQDWGYCQMDNLMDLIKGRRSVRTFDGNGIREEDLENLRQYRSF